ncbi:hypothetical protein [Acinetobacter bereziniae]|uniref:hypothetical protein n=1 Tax=Acinetobacter bereziniae TaxID=106648 RepID=UPI003AF597C4
MDKCREAFEKLPEIQKRLIYLDFDEGKQDYFLKPYSQDFRFVNLHFVRGAWMVWQSRQAEVENLQEEYAETELYLRGQLTDRGSKIANLKYLVEQDKSHIQTLNKKLEEKDKRIEAALVIVTKMAKATNSTAMWAYDLEKALRGDNANS